MPLIRVLAVLLIIALIVLLGMYIVTRRRSYLELSKRVLKFALWMLVFDILFFLLGRFIRW